MPPLPKSDKERLTARTAIVSILILFALADAYFVGVLYRARVGSFPDGKDVFRHLQVLSAIDREFSQRPDDAGFWETMHIFINSRVPYPPAPYVFAVLARRLVPSFGSYLSTIAYVFPYILAQFVGIYLMARRELPRARAMTVVAAVALLAPVTQAAGDFRVAYPTAAAVALSLGILTHVGTFVRAVPTVMFGLSVGFGLLTYYLYVLYVLPAAALVFVLRVRRADVRIPLLLIRAAQVMVPALVMAAPYYFQDRVIGLFAKEAAGVGAPHEPGGTHILETPAWWLTTIESAALYLKFILTHGWPFLLAVPAYVALRKQMRLSVLWLTAIVSVVVPLVFLCGFPGKQIDYVLPILLVAGVAALTLVLKWTGWRAAIALLLLVLALTRGTAGMLATGIRPISREEIRGGLAPLTDHCGRSHKVCRVLWSDCLASAGEYFLDRELGIDTRWTPSIDPAIPSLDPETVDFIVLMTLYDKSVQWDFNRRIFPKHIKAQCPPDYDLVDGKSSAISIRGRDVTSLFRSLNVMDDGTIRIEVLARRVPGAAGS